MIGYLKSRALVIFLLILVDLVFSLSLLFYGLPAAAIWYPLSLAVVIEIIAGLYDYLKQKRRLKILRHDQSLPFSLMEFPTSSSPQIQEYQKLIQKLLDELEENSQKARQAQSELIDYYTLWVHQIKTPITSMHLLLDEQDDEISRQLKLALLEIESYVEMVLAYIRLESQSSDYTFKKLSLDAIIQSSLAKLSMQFIQRGLRLDFQKSGLEIISDEKWLAFLLEQILSNALKYTKKGTISIYTQGKNLIIEDTGIGISQPDLKRVFEKGFTGINGRMDGKASGLGLYLSKRTADNLSIGLNIESVLQKGTRVILDFSQYRQIED